ncbi:hypothetical protein ACFCYH_34415 [Streptomyces sp. NPDC056400]
MVTPLNGDTTSPWVTGRSAERRKPALGLGTHHDIDSEAQQP